MYYYAADGTRFDEVTCRRADRYWVGPKGAQKPFTAFKAALAYLDSLPFFERRWRRPNKSGHWGIVRAIEVR